MLSTMSLVNRWNPYFVRHIPCDAAGNAPYSVQEAKEAMSGGRPTHTPSFDGVAKSHLKKTFDTIF
jgi:hypothetical protein